MSDQPKPPRSDRVDYGQLDLDEPAVATAAAEDHRRGIHHYGLPCCEPQPQPEPQP